MSLLKQNWSKGKARSRVTRMLRDFMVKAIWFTSTPKLEFQRETAENFLVIHPPRRKESLPKIESAFQDLEFCRP